MMDEETGRWQGHPLPLHHRGYKGTVMHRQTFWLMLPLPACICVPHNADWFCSIKVTLIACSAEETAAVSDLKLLKVQNLKVEMSGGTKAEHSRKKNHFNLKLSWVILTLNGYISPVYILSKFFASYFKAVSITKINETEGVGEKFLQGM